MSLRGSYAGIMSLALLVSACGGGGGGDGGQQPAPQPQTIAFATAGPVNGSVGTTVTNIASGGAGKVEHFYDALTAGGASAVLAASLFHFGELSVGDVKSYLRSRGLEVR